MRRNSLILLIFFSFLIVLLSQVSCRKKDRIISDPSLVLSFSTDTVFFDTVFATVGSVTQRLTVYNPNNAGISISLIYLGGGSNSPFRINVDGIASSALSDIEIPENDSIFIFVKVTVNPNSQNTPFIVSDSIVFITNGNTQKVKLVALGQNAFFHISENLNGIITWDSLKAHVVYGFCRIDTGAGLIILPGTKIYFHRGSYLAVSSQATLTVAGSLQHWVQLLGDRLDPYYRDLPGQWEGIYLEQGSRDHEINYALIANATYGLVVDSLGQTPQPMLKMNNSVIRNMTGDGLFAYNSSIISENCVIVDCGGSCIDILHGGNYDFRQLTLGNFWSSSVRFGTALYLSNFTIDTLGNKHPNPLDNAYFGNVIIYGSLDEEIQLDSVGGAAFNYLFDHALLKTKRNITNPNRYIDCMQNEDPLFVDVQNHDYQIDSLSPAIGKGIPLGVTLDILGRYRGVTPALGAYEFVPEP
jgi:hypothetical protein